MLRRLADFAFWAFVVAGVAAFGIALVSIFGLFGTEPDALGAVFAFVLALPWILWIEVPPGEDTVVGTAANLALVAVCIALNALLLHLLRRAARRRAARKAGAAA